MTIKSQKLTAKELRRKTDTKALNCKSTKDLKVLDDFIGQERAVKSIEFGLAVDSRGYNIFVVGSPGTGRTTYLLDTLTDKAKNMPTPDDVIYVYNFEDAAKPLAISLPAGKGKEIEEEFKDLIGDLKDAIVRAFEQNSFEEQKSKLVSSFQENANILMENLIKLASAHGFALKSTPQGFFNQPLKEQEDANGAKTMVEMKEEDFALLSDEEKTRLKQASEELTKSTIEGLKKVRESELKLKEEISKLESGISKTAIKPYFDELKKNFSDNPKLNHWFDTMAAHMVKNVASFTSQPGDKQAAKPDFSKYNINLLVSHEPGSGAPVILETNPTYYNLGGKMEYESSQGVLWTDYTKIVAGAFHNANGGFLIIDAETLLKNNMAYDLVKRILTSCEIQIENLNDLVGLTPVVSPKPEAAPLSCKVILIGGYNIFHLLQSYDPDFQKHFKMMAEFDTTMLRTQSSEKQVAQFVKTVVEKEGCLDFACNAIGEVIDYSSRLADDQEKISLQFSKLEDLIIESATWAKIMSAHRVETEHVRQAIKQKYFRSSLMEDKVRQNFAENAIKIVTHGSEVGQINGLAVLTVGDVSFGHPTRITANTFMGREGVVNIERETKMAGPIHNKGLLTLSSYLGRIYAQKMPLALSARLAFEQNYGGIDGDSASSTELYCLLSSLSDVPINQAIAVTGSVDQFGNIQTIGGVNEKIEGYFSYCSIQGLTGEQGVMIPWQNARNLMLNHDVVDAVEAGLFHIWKVNTIDDGIEILTGVKAGKPNKKGVYPKDSIHGKVIAKLKHWIEASSPQPQIKLQAVSMPSGMADPDEKTAAKSKKEEEKSPNS